MSKDVEFCKDKTHLFMYGKKKTHFTKILT